MRDPEVIDSELRSLAAIRRTVAELGGLRSRSLGWWTSCLTNAQPPPKAIRRPYQPDRCTGSVIADPES